MKPNRLTSGFLGLAIALLLPSAGLAQGEAEDIDAVADTVGILLRSVRQAANNGDWDRMKAHFPSETPWAAQVERTVTGALPAGAVSFWLPRTRLAEGGFAVEMVAVDIATVGASFTVDDAVGTWGAVLIHGPEGWRFHCTIEMFGQWKEPPPARTGCVRRLDPA